MHAVSMAPVGRLVSRTAIQGCASMGPPCWHAVRRAPADAGSQPAYITPQTLKLKMIWGMLMALFLPRVLLKMMTDHSVVDVACVVGP